MGIDAAEVELRDKVRRVLMPLLAAGEVIEQLPIAVLRHPGQPVLHFLFHALVERRPIGLRQLGALLVGQLDQIVAREEVSQRVARSRRGRGARRRFPGR